MIIYIIIIALIVILWLNETQDNSAKYTLIVFLCFFALLGFRDYSVGVDTQSYIDEYIYDISSLRVTDVGYTYYNLILKSLGCSPRLFLIITSLIISYSVYRYIKQIGDGRMFSYLLYITIGTLSMHLSGIRQSLAMSIALMGYLFAVCQRKTINKYGILLFSVFLATTVHASAVICYLYIPFLLLSNRNIKLKTFSLFISAVIPLIMAMTPLPQYLITYFMTERYEMYGNSSINIFAFFIIPYVVFLYILFLIYRIKALTPYEKFGFFCSILYAVAAASSLYLPIVNRTSFYFNLPTIVLVASLTSRLPRSERSLFETVIAVVCIAFFFIAINGDTMKIDNYSFFFFK